MPLYEYRCTKCGYRFEKIQSFNAEAETECPRCHGALERPLTAPALQFKGAGWYVNDYAPKAAGGSSESKPAEAASSTTESKPAGSDSSTKSTSSESSSSSASSSSDSASKPASSSTTT